MKRNAHNLTLLLVIVAVAVACGGSADGDGSATLAPTASPVPFVPPGTTLVPETNQSTTVSIRGRGNVRVGVLFNNPPFSRLTNEGELVGFEVDLVRAMAEQWGVDVQFLQVTRQTRVAYLLDGEVDMLAAAVPHRRELHGLMDFSQSTFKSGLNILVPETSEVEGIADLNGQAVAIVEPEAFEVVAEQARDAGVTPTAQQFDTTDEAVDGLLGGEVAAVVARRETLMRATQNRPELTVRDEFLLVEPYAFALRRGDADFRNLIDVTLQGLVGDGTYAQLFTEHLYGYPADQLTVWPGDAIPTLDALPGAVGTPSESVVARIAGGGELAVAGLGAEYDDPELDGQRLVDDFNRAILNEFARRWDVSFDEVGGAGDAAKGLVATGDADLAFGTIPRRDLSGGVDYSQIYLERGMRLVRHADVEIGGMDDLDDHPVAVLGPDRYRELVTGENTGVELVDVTSSRHALSLLEAQAASAVLADELTVGLLAREDPTLVVLEEVFDPLPYAIAVPRYDSDFRALVNFTLQDLYADGTLARLVTQYFGPYAPDEQPAEPFPIEEWPGSTEFLGLPVGP